MLRNHILQKHLRNITLSAFLLTSAICEAQNPYLPPFTALGEQYEIASFNSEHFGFSPDTDGEMLTRTDGVMFNGFYWLAGSFPIGTDGSQNLVLDGFSSEGKDSSDWQTLKVSEDGHQMTGTKLVVFNGKLRVLAMVGLDNNAVLYYQDFLINDATDPATSIVADGNGWQSFNASGDIHDFTAVVAQGQLYVFYVTSDQSSVYLATQTSTGSALLDQGSLALTNSASGSFVSDVFGVDALVYYEEGSSNTSVEILLGVISGDKTAPTLGFGDFAVSTNSANLTVGSLPKMATNSSGSQIDTVPGNTESKGIRMVNGVCELVDVTGMTAKEAYGATVFITVQNTSGNQYIQLNVGAISYAAPDPSGMVMAAATESFSSVVTGWAGRFGVGLLQLATDDTPPTGQLSSIQEYVVIAGLGVLTLADSSDGYQPESSLQLAKSNYLYVADQYVLTDTNSFSGGTTTEQQSGSLTSMSTQVAVDNAVDAWTLVGVLHGPPPLAGNDQSPNVSTIDMSFDDGGSQTSSTSLSQSNDTTFSAGIGTTIPVFDIDDSYSDSTSTTSVGDSSLEASIAFEGSYTFEVTGTDTGATGQLIFLAPVVNNQPYQVYAYNFALDGATVSSDSLYLNAIYYMTWIEDTTLTFLPYTMTNTSLPADIVTLNGVTYSSDIAAGMLSVPGSLDIVCTSSTDTSGTTTYSTSWQCSNQFANTSSSATGYTVASTGSVTPSLEAQVSGGSTISVSYTQTSTSAVSNATSSTQSSGASVGVSLTNTGTGSDGSFGFTNTTGSSSSVSTSLTLGSTVSQYFTDSYSIEYTELVPATVDTVNNFSQITTEPYLVLPGAPGNGNWIPSEYNLSAPFLITWKVTQATYTPASNSDSSLSASTAVKTTSFASLSDLVTSLFYFGEVSEAELNGVYYSPFMNRWIYTDTGTWTFDYAKNEWRYFIQEQAVYDQMLIWSPSNFWMYSTYDLFPWYYRFADNKWLYDG